MDGVWREESDECETSPAEVHLMEWPFEMVDGGEDWGAEEQGGF